ncbi:hypothetical protein AWN90_00615 [Nocardia terpenica]|uniref:Dienelactone hydrolase domain-containing protein n=2 Tax=Nocardia terpenica TaxID=455432 RepID=A0A164KEI0_9NOCA|nr:hypothetical protein AWN90_00615 [Nocardia terpenica]
MSAAEYQARIAAEGIDAVLDRMTADWLSSIRALGISGIVDVDHLAYLGMSMGTRLGIPVAAALDGRLRCVVLGKFGFRQGPALHEGLRATERLAAEARRISAPTLLHLQWDDELFPRDGQLAFFDALGARDKQLIGYVGSHAEANPDAVSRWCDFVCRHLLSEAVVDCDHAV